jgi:hypothetical protein
MKPPFVPCAEQEYRVDYLEGTESRFLLGTIEFPEDAPGIIVTRTRVNPKLRIYLPVFTKVEELSSAPSTRPSARFP